MNLAPVRHRRLIAILLLLSSSLAYGTEAPVCELSTISGPYGFTISGTNLNSGTFFSNAQFAMAGRLVSNGKGVFTGTGTQSIKGKIFRGPFHGTYTVAADCTGKAILYFGNGGESANLDFAIAADGNELMLIVSDAGTVESGTAKRQFSTRSEVSPTTTRTSAASR